MKNKFILIKSFNYLFKDFSKIPIHSKIEENTKRIVDDISNLEVGKNIILSTYFTTKNDPQRGVGINKNDFNYIENFYNSVISSNYNLIIFHDSLNDDFIKKYTNSNVKFIKCKILCYSLNDERFYIYKEFLNIKKVEKLIMCDINDVTFNLNKDIFNFIKNNIFYIGRDELSLIGTNEWIRNKINILPKEIKQHIPPIFYNMPVVNAGVIGGDYNVINLFLKELIILFEFINNDNNNNMICVNIVFYNLFWTNYINRLNYKLINLRNNQKYLNQKSITYSNFNLGFPFTSSFKMYEKSNEIYIYHK